MLHLKDLVRQVGGGIESGALARPDQIGVSARQPPLNFDLDAETLKQRGMGSDDRMAGSEDGEVADKGRRSFLRHSE